MMMMMMMVVVVVEHVDGHGVDDMVKLVLMELVGLHVLVSL